MKGSKTRAHHRKHAGTSKHHTKSKHTPTAHKGHHHAHKQVARRITTPMISAKPRQWTPDGDVACCSARAVAESLRIALGRDVSDAAVLDLYWHTAGDADAGASILATLEAAAASGLGGARLLNFSEVAWDMPAILGLELPEGPHAVLDDGRSWWSWGEPYDPADFPGAVIEEVWAVTW